MKLAARAFAAMLFLIGSTGLQPDYDEINFDSCRVKGAVLPGHPGGLPTWRQRPRHHPARHFSRARPLQCRRQLIEAGAGGHHVVNQGDVKSPNRILACECVTHIAPPSIVLQAHLWRGVADAPAEGGVDREAGLFGDDAGDFSGMVEATFADAGRVEWHRDK
jgi:hypothetical protein